MSNPNDKRDELLKLADAACEQRLSDEDAARLEELVTTDDQLRRLYKIYVEVHAAAERYLPRLVEDPAIAEQVELRDDHSDREWARLISQESLANGSQRRRVPWLAGTIVVLLLAAGAWFFAQQNGWFSEEEKSPEFATLTAMSDCRWPDGAEKVVGARLSKNETLTLLDGVAEITFDNETTIVLGAPTTFTLTDPMEGYLLKGKLVANVSEQVVGFTLRSPNAEVVDLGTKFGLQVPMIGPTEVHVFEGEVEVTYFDEEGNRSEPIVLKQDDAALVDTAASTVSESVANPNRFDFNATESQADKREHFTEKDGIVAFEAESFTQRAGPGRNGDVWRIDAASKNEFSDAKGRRFARLTSDTATVTQFGAFEGASLDYDFEITNADTYQVWIRGAACGSGPDGRPGEVVELTELRYRNDAFTGSRAIAPIKSSYNKPVGVWQIGDTTPKGEATVPQFEVGSRMLNQSIPAGAKKIFLAMHDSFQWTNNAGQIAARVTWERDGTAVPIRVDDVMIDANTCIWFAWATDEQLGAPGAGKGPYQESTDHRPLSLAVPPSATAVSISAAGAWSHVEQLESFAAAVQAKLFRIDESESANQAKQELTQTGPIALNASQAFQWTLVATQEFQPGRHRLTLYAATPAVAIDKIVIQQSSKPNPD